MDKNLENLINGEKAPFFQRFKNFFYGTAFFLALGVAYCGENSAPAGCRSDAECREPRICENGDCVSPGQTCTDECSPSGKKECFGNGYKTCGDYDSDSCLEWSSLTGCGTNQYCEDGRCEENSSCSCHNDCNSSMDCIPACCCKENINNPGNYIAVNDDCISELSQNICSEICPSGCFPWGTSFCPLTFHLYCVNNGCVVTSVEP